MRLDQRIVADGLAESRAKAQALIKAGLVRVEGAVCAKPSREVADASVVLVTGFDCPWVSRAGLKLAHAFETFDLSIDGRVTLDLGASTGGFTEVCLSRGAAKVYAVDVGRGQLHQRLREDQRVVSMEGVNARDLTQAQIPEPPAFVTADLSFISLAKALPAPLALTTPQARGVLLVKPQFEVGRSRIGKGGIVKDAAARDAAEAEVGAALDALGWRVLDRTTSPILGGDGNEERLVLIERRGA